MAHGELYAVRGNKRLKITPAEKPAHLALGYDIAELKGKKLEVIEHAPAKTVPYGQHRAALARITALEKEIAKLRKAQDKGKGKDDDSKEGGE